MKNEGCSVSLCEGGIWECQREELLKAIDKYKSALQEIADVCPILEELHDDGPESKLEDACWQSTKRRRNIAREALAQQAAGTEDK